MLRYLRAAFLFRIPITGLGAVPANILGVLAFMILGFALPGLWLLGLGLELAYLFALATNARFQRLVDSRASAAVAERDDQWQRTVVERLPTDSRRRVLALDDKIQRTLYLYNEMQTEPFLVDTNRAALEKLGSSYVELLRAKQTLATLGDARAAEKRIRSEAEVLEREIGEPELSPLARDAKAATLDTLQRQLEHLERREASIREIDSYLAQIEAQVDLALESAALRGRPEAISAEIDVASFLLDERRYNDALASESSGSSDPIAPPNRARERQ
jgi:hypothetical protein